MRPMPKSVARISYQCVLSDLLKMALPLIDEKSFVYFINNIVEATVNEVVDSPSLLESLRDGKFVRQIDIKDESEKILYKTFLEWRDESVYIFIETGEDNCLENKFGFAPDHYTSRN